MNIINQNRAVQEQYKTANNLDKRISIHTKYSTNKMGFGNWIFSHYNIVPNIQILELGCGTGDIWKLHLDLLDNGNRLYLTDFSEGMISVAKNNLGKSENIVYDVVDIQNIPYKDNSFDIVIANMMLYHVPNLEKGLCEVKRVLKNSGYFYCATYGINGIVPYIAGLLKEYGISDTTNKNFTLQNGNDILKKYFSNIKRLDYEDSLAVTDIDDLIDYIYSLSGMVSIAKIKRLDLKKVLESHTVNGVLNIPKEYGMFICRK